MHRLWTQCSLAFLIALIALPSANAGKAKLTSYQEMLTRLAALQAVDASTGSRRLTVSSIGASVEGRDIILVRVVDSEVPLEATRRLFVVCRQHGNEPAPTEAMLNLIEQLVTAADDATADLLRRVSFFIVPMMNPDGAVRFVRRNAKGVDLNRDWIALSQPETLCVRAQIDEVSPDVIIDQHELSPGNRTTDFLETAGLTSGAFPDTVIESMRLQDLVIGMLRTHGIAARNCTIEDLCPARLAHRYFPIFHSRKTLLFETRQSGDRQYRLQYRMKLHIVGTMAVARYLAGEEEAMRQKISRYDSSRRWVQLASRGPKRTPTARWAHKSKPTAKRR